MVAASDGDIQAIHNILPDGVLPHMDACWLWEGSARYVSAIYAAALGGHHSAVVALLNAGAKGDAPGIFDGQNDGATPLFAAAINGHLEVARVLIEHGAKVDEPERTHGETPLLVAVYQNHNEMVRYLLEKGADHSIVGSQDGAPVILLAVENQNLQMVEMLLANGADVDRADTRKGFTPLMRAALDDNMEMVIKLLASGATPNKPANGTESPFDVGGPSDYPPVTPLYIAAHEEHIEVLKLLLDAGKDVNTNEDLEVAMLVAVGKCRPCIVEFLAQL
jgi:ankyrin repeat protein